MKNRGIVKKPNDKYAKKRTALAIISLVIVVVLSALVTYFVYNAFKEHCSSTQEFKEYIDSFGIYSTLVALGIQVLQVVIALIPGEIVELSMGYAFGFWKGTAFCLLGCFIGSVIVFLLVRKFGVKLLNILFDIDKLNQLKFLENENRLNYYVFLLFFIPGTPKDLLTYFAGVTKIKMSTFLIISTIARIPSVVTSTIVGNLVGGNNYIVAIIVYAIVGVISFIGIRYYNKIHKTENEKILKKQQRKEKRKKFREKLKLKAKPKLGKIVDFKNRVKMKTRRVKVKTKSNFSNSETVLCAEPLEKESKPNRVS